jgi:D-serine deaminase-like pyridoxal phosphate-dependent protein
MEAQHVGNTTTLVKDLPSPAFLIHQSMFQQNCRVVATEAKRCGVAFRPHIKTHKTVKGLKIQLDEALNVGTAVTGFVASTIPEVRLFAQAMSVWLKAFKSTSGSSESSSWAPNPKYQEDANSVLYAVPIAEFRLKALYELQQSYPNIKIHLLVDHPKQVEFIDQFATALRQSIDVDADDSNGDGSSGSPRTLFGLFSVYMKVDTGYHRAGISPDENGVALAKQIYQSPFTSLAGIYSHWWVYIRVYSQMNE